MKLFFCSSIYNMDEYDSLKEKSKCSLSLANHTLNYNIIKGLDIINKNETVLINCTPLPSFPTFPNIFIKKELWNHNKHITYNDINIGYINYPIIKQITKYFSYYFCFKNKIKNNPMDKVIFLIYDLNLPLVKAMVRIKKKFPMVSICAILPDIPDSIINVVFGKRPSIIAQYYTNQKMKYINHFDGYVFLTEHMKEKVNVREKPYTVVEGIYNDSSFSSIVNAEVEEKKIIMYSGALREIYGIKRIVDIISSLCDKSYELWLCGDGELTNYIKNESKKYVNIKYFGYLNTQEICDLQSKATILINPRKNEGEYTKYSFPSKTMEYLASGKPVIGYNLDGFPNEYKDFIQIPENETDEALKKKIIEICSLPIHVREKMGQKSRNFILTQKNPKVQCKKIMLMLENVEGVRR